MEQRNMRDRITGPITSLIEWVELLLALFIVIAVIINIKDVVRLLYELCTVSSENSHNMLSLFLEHILLLVIGLELTETLIRHTPGSIIEVMLYAIARKMLIHSTNTYELLAGAAAIAALFAVKKFFIPKEV